MTESTSNNALTTDGTDRPPAKKQASSRGKKQKIIWFAATLLGLVLLLGGLAGVKASQIAMLMKSGEQAAKNGPPPEAVSTTRAVTQTWEETLNAIGSVVSAKGVAVSADTPGVVSKVLFESGDSVRRGQALVELDAKVEQAQLRSIRARRTLAEVSLDRSRLLLRSGAATQSTVDTDEATLKSLSAELSALEAQIERKTIRAPFSGRLGIRQVNLGQYLAPGSVVTVLESVKTAYVDFSLPQHDIENLEVGMPVRVSEEKTSEPTSIEGAITAIDSGVDAATRTIKVRASLPDQDRMRPGMFVRVAVVLPQKVDVIAVPATAVVHASYGDSIFSVDGSGAAAPGGGQRKIARQHFVKLGQSRGDFVSVVDGVKAGEEVVVSGAFKLRNNAPIVIDNTTVALGPQLNPLPENR